MYEVTHKNGERWNTARAFLDDNMARPNLTVITHAMAQKVIVENGRATGVDVKVKGTPRTITARRELITAKTAKGCSPLTSRRAADFFIRTAPNPPLTYRLSSSAPWWMIMDVNYIGDMVIAVTSVCCGPKAAAAYG